MFVEAKLQALSSGGYFTQSAWRACANFLHRLIQKRPQRGAAVALRLLFISIVLRLRLIPGQPKICGALGCEMDGN